MAAVVKTGRTEPSVPVFAGIEPLLVEFSSLRGDVASASSPSADLIRRMDEAIEVATSSRDRIAAAAAPGTSIAIGTYLAMLLKAYPNAGQQDATFYGGFLHDDVTELRPPIAAVEIACRRWRQKSKFPPAISELLDDVKAAKSAIENAVEFISKLPALRDRMVREMANS